ncbi:MULTISPECIES: anti-sigma factor family protein [Mumia]|uniref:anti-sigma factor family protein n=1 Tax=Mumia TaxID=1546255 RepID=UPI00141E65F4|nr:MULTISPECIES: zf-HC2 domain-containing protein [unclassified Mumia]QMW67901.1 zf-HC2 domain-containing protein [Mumia sp. ZJ1417]
MTCPYEHLDGAYVLGSLSTADRLEFENHLAGCEACQQAVQELAGLPGLLSKVPVDVWDPPETDEPLPESLRPTVLALAARQRQRRRWVSVGIAAAAAVAVVAGGFAAGAQWGSRDEPAAQNPPTSQPTTEPTSQPTTEPTGTPMVPAEEETSMTAQLALSTVAWGTKLALTCSYPTAGPYEGEYGGAATYALVVLTRDGQEEHVATWRGLPGKTMHLTAATATPRADIASVEVRDADGSAVLRTPA